MKDCFAKVICSDNKECCSQDWAHLIFRLSIGLILAFGHGLGKLPPSEQFISGVTALGFPMPLVFAWLAALSEFAGGLCLALGFLTRPASFFIAFTMAVAFFLAHASDPFNRKEMALLYLLIALFFFFRGGGKYSLDAVMEKHCGCKKS